MGDIEAIIEGCKKNKELSQSQLYKYLAPKLMGVCVRYTKSRYTAEDYLQDSFIKIFNYIHQYSGVGSIEGWARRILVNTILTDIKKHKSFYNSMDVSELTDIPHAEENIISDLNHQELIGCVHSLPEGKRVVFNLFVMEGFSHKEIADQLNITEGTSKSQLSKAKEMLVKIHKELNKEYEKKIS